MAKEDQKLFWTGLISGILGTAVIVSLMHSSAAPSKKSTDQTVLAEVNGQSLTRNDLRSRLASQLIPVETDEYQILSQGTKSWVDGKVLELEAKEKGLKPADLYLKAVWPQVKISEGDVLDHYNQNRELYNQPYEKISSLLTQQIRTREYKKAEREYLDSLREKFHAKIYLSKPDLYSADAALPNQPEIWPSVNIAGTAPSVPAAVPSVAAPAPAPSPAPAQPSKVTTFDDLAGRPSMGPENAPNTIVEFSDFHCPFCKKGADNVKQLMKQYEGRVRLVFRHYPLPFHQGADKTHEAAECAHEQGKFWPYHDKIFETQGQSRDEAALTAIAEQTGLNKTQFQQCLTSGKYKAVVQKDMAKAAQVGVRGTPSFFINGKFVAGAYPPDYLISVMEGKVDPAAPQEAKPAPKNVKFDDLAGRPAEGPENAPITLVIFSDYHCPFCKKIEPTIDQLMKNYSGKIRKIWRHYPLPFHKGADRTHQASECAHEQGKFWQYHNKLFETQGGARDDASLTTIATQLGLDKVKFEQCLTSGKYKTLVESDITKGSSVGVDGTPAVFVNGDLVSGAQPYENFDQIVKNKLQGK